MIMVIIGNVIDIGMDIGMTICMATYMAMDMYN